MTRNYRLIAAVPLMLLIHACVSVEGPRDPFDPWEGYNRSMTKFNDKLDKYVVKPVAKGYFWITPTVVNKGVTNFFSNLGDVIVFANDIMQLKIKSALDDFSRVAYNSVFGLGGFLDVATEMGLEKRNEDFGQTMGYWGVPKGPYFVLPLIGPSTVRDTFGLATDIFVFDPVTTQVDNIWVQYQLYGLQIVDIRADLLPAGDIVKDASLDPYIFIRDAYLQRRLNHIYDGDIPDEVLDQQY